jgi:hypothetical protein
VNVRAFNVSDTEVAGEYPERAMTIRHNITIRAASGSVKMACLHHGEPLFTVLGANLTLVGLNISRCHTNTSHPLGAGGAVTVRNGALSLQRCAFVGNSANNTGPAAGAVMLSSDSSMPSMLAPFRVDIEGCTFKSNHASSQGVSHGAVGMFHERHHSQDVTGAVLLVNGSAFRGNSAIVLATEDQGVPLADWSDLPRELVRWWQRPVCVSGAVGLYIAHTRAEAEHPPGTEPGHGRHPGGGGADAGAGAAGSGEEGCASEQEGGAVGLGSPDESADAAADGEGEADEETEENEENEENEDAFALVGAREPLRPAKHGVIAGNNVAFTHCHATGNSARG